MTWQWNDLAPRGLRHLAWPGALLAALAFGCKEPPPPVPTCPDSYIIVADASGTDSHRHRRGQIKLLERHYADGSAATTVVGAKFGDFTLSTAESQGGIQLSDACVGLTGQPVRSDKHCEYTSISCDRSDDCDPGVECREYDRLDVAGVRIDGLAGGSIELDRQANSVGTFVKAGLSQLFGDSQVAVYVTASTDTAGHRFAGRDISLDQFPAPRFVNVTSPDLGGATSLGHEDLIVNWEPGNPDDDVFIDVIAEQTSTLVQGQTRNASLSCIAIDQGCQTLWGAALTWLLTPEADWRLTGEVTIMVGRRSEQTYDLSADTPDTEISASLTAEVQGKMLP